MSAGPQPAFRLNAEPGGLLVLRITLHSHMVAPAVLRPALAAWVAPSGKPIETRTELSPANVYLSPGRDVRITVTARMPTDVGGGASLRGALLLEGSGEAPVPLVVDLVDEAAADQFISMTLPFSPYSTDPGMAAAGTKAISTLLSGLAGAEVIPARWVVAELLVAVAERGHELAQTEHGAALLGRLRRLRFFKNGVLALRGVHLPSWVMIGVTVSSGLYSALGGREVQGRLLYAWQKWLFDLIDADLENFDDDSPAVRLTVPEVERTLEMLGNEAEDWFGYLLLGLAALSPRIRDVIETLAEHAPAPALAPAAEVREIPDVLSEKGSIQR